MHYFPPEVIYGKVREDLTQRLGEERFNQCCRDNSGRIDSWPGLAYREMQKRLELYERVKLVFQEIDSTTPTFEELVSKLQNGNFSDCEKAWLMRFSCCRDVSSLNHAQYSTMCKLRTVIFWSQLNEKIPFGIESSKPLLENGLTLLMDGDFRPHAELASMPKWRGESVLSNKAVWRIPKMDGKTVCFINLKTLYHSQTYTGLKKIYNFVDPHHSQRYAAVRMEETDVSLDVMLFSTRIQSQNCPFLVPPFKCIIKKVREHNKAYLLGIRKLYQCSIEKLDLSYQEQINVVLSVIEALEYLIRKGYIHGDIKRPNVLQDSEGNFVLADYDLAHRIGEKCRKGTPRCVAPEVLYAEYVSQPERNLWEIGVLGMEMLGLTCGEEFEHVKLKGLTPAYLANYFVEQELKLKISVENSPGAAVALDLFHLYCRCQSLVPSWRPSLVEIRAELLKIQKILPAPISLP